MTSVILADVNVFVAALIAAMLVYFFSSLRSGSVGTTAQAIIVDVRRQFREIPRHHGLTPAGRDYGSSAVGYHGPRAPLREMMLPRRRCCGDYPSSVRPAPSATRPSLGLLIGRYDRRPVPARHVRYSTIGGGACGDNAKQYIGKGVTCSMTTADR